MQVCPTEPKSRDSPKSIAATSDRKANVASGFTVAEIEPPSHGSLQDFVRGATQPSDHQAPMLTRLHGIRYVDSQQVNDREALPPKKSSSMGENVDALHDQWALPRATRRGIVAKRHRSRTSLRCNATIEFGATLQGRASRPSTCDDIFIDAADRLAEGDCGIE